MEMPCICECGECFDLHEGYKSLHNDIVICEQCHDKEEKEDEINRLENEIYDLEKEIEFNTEQIETLKEENLEKEREKESLEEKLEELQKDL